MKMNYLTPIICFFFIIQSFAQPTQSRRNVPTDAFKTYEESLTPLEKDSLKNGKIPLVLAQKWELQRQKQLFIQDSILKTMVGQLVPDLICRTCVIVRSWCIIHGCNKDRDHC